MRCELRSLHSPDLYDLESDRPPDQDSFSILVQAMIGPLGGKGEESFSFVYCTPDRIASELADGGYRWGHSLLLTCRYDYRLLLAAVQRVCHRVEAETWTDLTRQLSYHFSWEFENYEPSSDAGVD